MPRSARQVPTRHSLLSLRSWYRQPLGEALAAAEQQALSDVLGDIFGYHLVVLDPPCQPEALDASRILHRVVQTCCQAGLECRPAVLGAADALPMQADSVDAFVLPHVLDISADPHQVLREIDRCLLAEGHLIILGFNPHGWWGVRRLLFGWRGRVPWSLPFVSLPRLREWLSLLGFDTLQTRHLFPYPPWHYGQEHSGGKLLPHSHNECQPLLAASYLLVARKRVTTLTPIKPRWRPRRSLLAGGVAETGQGRARYRSSWHV
ncbi:FIG005121: SAM-dependent methyltransferase [hydrothermal vent metagenome]|uniref:FIG005121: SAM-dependent methyltransferase n=1 Tax=hydrothermal vent metagenome TaxID=652676 RepID=A0A3B0YBT6_9ZZZZ